MDRLIGFFGASADPRIGGGDSQTDRLSCTSVKHFSLSRIIKVSPHQSFILIALCPNFSINVVARLFVGFGFWRHYIFVKLPL